MSKIRFALRSGVFIVLGITYQDDGQPEKIGKVLNSKNTNPHKGRFERITNANHDHAYTRLASSGERLFALGDGRHSAYGEFYSVDESIWTDTTLYLGLTNVELIIQGF